MTMRFGICQWRVPENDPERCIKWVAENGFEGVAIDLGDDVNDFPLSHKDVQTNYALWGKKWNIQYPSIGVGFLCKYGMVKKSNKRAVHLAIKKGIDAAMVLNIPVVQLPSFYDGEIKTPEDYLNTADCLRFACSYAAGSEILIETENTLSAEEQIKLLKDVGASSLRICFDTRNPFSKKRLDPPMLLEKLFPYVCEVHLKDGVDNEGCTQLGQGNSEFFRSLNLLLKLSFAGWVLLENDYHYMSKVSGIHIEELVREDINIVKSLAKKTIIN